jgi:predicted MPP superfamily phosphohydrolase
MFEDLILQRYVVPIRGLAPRGDPVRLVLLSDFHVGRLAPMSRLRHGIELARSLAPDFFLLGGDFVQSGAAHVGSVARLVAPLVKSGSPVLSVLGNHDYWGGAPALRSALADVGIHALDNTHAFYLPATRELVDILPDATPASPDRRVGLARGLCLAGLADLQEDRPDIRAALAGVDPTLPTLLLAHNPDSAELPALRGRRIDLMLSGHTHGGQVLAPIIGAPWIPCTTGSRYRYGVIKGPSCRVLVTSGVGDSTLPLRFGIAPEVVEVTLLPAPPEALTPPT